MPSISIRLLPGKIIQVGEVTIDRKLAGVDALRPIEGRGFLFQ
jgi:hypothetical protein